MSKEFFKFILLLGEDCLFGGFFFFLVNFFFEVLLTGLVLRLFDIFFVKCLFNVKFLIIFLVCIGIFELSVVIGCDLILFFICLLENLERGEWRRGFFI